MSKWLDKYKVDVPEAVSGDWRVARFKVNQEDEKLQRLQCACNPQRPARVVPAGEYTKLTRGGQLVMSDTPDEIADHLPAICAAEGHCFVGGLGLGVVVAAMLNKPSVTKVTVVELSPDVIKLVGWHLSAAHIDRLEIVEADLLTWKPPRGAKYGVAWFDIWDSISADNLPQMATLNRRFARKAKWKGCWQQAGCRDQRARVPSGRAFY